MPDGLTTEILKPALARMAAKMESCFDELNALDSRVGDGDIGVTMQTGFRAMLAAAADLPADLGLALAKCAQSFVGVRGSSFGTLFATGLLAAAAAVKGQSEAAWSQIPTMLERAIAKMALRGRSGLGDKTVLDELEAIRASLLEIADPQEMLAAADRAALRALEEFRSRPCKQGRARIFADKTIGLDDPGMVVIQKLVEGLKREGS